MGPEWVTCSVRRPFYKFSAQSDRSHQRLGGDSPRNCRRQLPASPFGNFSKPEQRHPTRQTTTDNDHYPQVQSRCECQNAILDHLRLRRGRHGWICWSGFVVTSNRGFLAINEAWHTTSGRHRHRHHHQHHPETIAREVLDGPMEY